MAGETTNPPLYCVLLHFWIRLFGNSEAALRPLSVAPSVVGVVVTYFLGTRLYNERTGLIAACVMALSTFQILLAQEARSFALLLAMLSGSMLSMDAALLSKNTKARTGAAALYALTTIAALYTLLCRIFYSCSKSLRFAAMAGKQR